MSAFLLYFESKSINSTDYEGFSSVGNFVVPDEVFAGSIELVVNGSTYTAAIISDRGRQSCNDYFLRNNETSVVKEIMFNFINGRLKNECVIPNVAKFIFNDQEVVALTEKKLVINSIDLEKIFDRELFDRGVYLSIER